MKSYKIVTRDGIWSIQAESFSDALSQIQGFYVPISVVRAAQ